MHAQEMISAHPQVRGDANEALTRCIETCLDCAQVCTSCADACLGEEMVADLRQCIRTDLDCADVCALTATLASRRTGSNDGLLLTILQACEETCRLCAEECGRHADMHAHCRICAETCRRCAAVCREAGATMEPRQH